jgi:hypothetical protein
MCKKNLFLVAPFRGDCGVVIAVNPGNRDAALHLVSDLADHCRPLPLPFQRCSAPGFFRVANQTTKIRKPFDVLAEGFLSKKSRGDWTPLELFVAGVRCWEAGLRWTFICGPRGNRL